MKAVSFISKGLLWKIYFWLFVGLNVLALPLSENLGNLLFSIFFISSLGLALYSYIFKKQFFPRWVWIIIFCILFISILLRYFTLFNYESIRQASMKEGAQLDIPQPNLLDNLIYDILLLPVYFALLKLGYKNFSFQVFKSVQFWWKLYFWSLVLMAILAGIGFMLEISSLKSGDWIGIAGSFICLIGLYSYVFRKLIFTAFVWKIVFWSNIAITIFYLMYVLTPFSSNIILKFVFQTGLDIQFTTLQYIFSFLLGTPTFYAFYKLGYKKS